MLKYVNKPNYLHMRISAIKFTKSGNLPGLIKTPLKFEVQHHHKAVENSLAHVSLQLIFKAATIEPLTISPDVLFCPV